MTNSQTRSEATDAILTHVSGGHETPILALEYCGALPAGNQAWQRSGRAYSYAHAHVPFLYVAELGGYELDANRNRKAARLPNPAVPFSYALLSRSTSAPAFPIFLRSPGADAASVKMYGPIYGESELLALIRCCLFSESVAAVQMSLEKKVLDLVKLLSSPEGHTRNDTLKPAQWSAALAHVRSNGDLLSYLIPNAPLPWSKTAYIEALTPSVSRLMGIASQYGIGLTSTKLPLCIIPSNKRSSFSNAVCGLYPGLPDTFVKWLRQSGHLVVCWVMGFKPRGDDARPDRGLPPLGRMLIGEGTDLLTVVYGPAPKATWPLLANAPRTLMQRNGLWEAILAISDAVLIDSQTAPHTPIPVYTRQQWFSAVALPAATELFVEPVPLQVGEQDVDTVLHLMFDRIAGDSVFEGLCNPPGGDWSGLSLLTNDRSAELRWLGLPRVTAEGAKRPDHVFQVFSPGSLPIIVAIESKDAAGDVEDGIGPRLTKYVLDLVASAASVERATASEPWLHSTRAGSIAGLKTVSVAAFVAHSDAEVRQVALRAAVDLVLGFTFSPDHKSCALVGKPCTAAGKSLWAFISKFKCEPIALDFRSVQ